uniref:Uncharacterized protein n=1 Tax=Meloidogyne enterolobii TaxID=390850 RepID=A0A6V7W874_MELEN|nr:unnamed protein product [Meloidogyne enterolobii]
MTTNQQTEQIQNMGKLFNLQGRINFLTNEVDDCKDEVACGGVSQSNPCGQHLNKLLSLKGMVDLFVREIPEELYHSKYKNPVAVFDKGNYCFNL